MKALLFIAVLLTAIVGRSQTIHLYGSSTMTNGGPLAFYRNDQLLWTPPTLLTMTANVTNANGTANTLSNITQLSFPVTTGNTYKIQAVIYFTTAATTTGTRWCVTGPAVTAAMFTSEYTLTATTSTRNAMVQGTSLPAACNATSAAGANLATITGFLRPSADGTLAIAFASEITNSAVIAQSGSTLEYWQ